MEDTYRTSEADILGACPVCGAGVVESDKTFGCSDWKGGCKFTIWKNDKFLDAVGKTPDREMITTLLTKGKYEAKNLLSKRTGKNFDAILSYEKDEESGYYRWNMEFPNNK